MVLTSLFLNSRLIDLNNIFVIKKPDGYQRVFLAGPTVVSLTWRQITVFDRYLRKYKYIYIYIYIYICEQLLVAYHLPNGRFFNIHFMPDSLL